MIIDVTGFGWSGSGAVIDLLSEYDNSLIFHSRCELSILHNVDGIIDLESKLIYKHCRIFDSDIAIKRFLRLVDLAYSKQYNGMISKLCIDYINHLIGIRFVSRSAYDVVYNQERGRLLGRTYNKAINILFANRVSKQLFKGIADKLRWHNTNIKFLSYMPQDFMQYTQNLMEDIFALTNKKDTDNLITDHLFSPDNPIICFKYIKEQAKCIIVRRDPRDTYILAKKIYKGEIPIPVDTVENYIWFYRETIQATKQADSDCILNVNFEELVYDYDNTKKRIEKFCGLKNHTLALTKFKPSISINNTQLFRLYGEYTDDINKIEAQLSNSLFDFDKYRRSDLKNNRKIF